MNFSTYFHSVRGLLISLAIFVAYITAHTQPTIENVRDSFDQSRQLMFIYYDLKGLSLKQEILIVPRVRLGDTLLTDDYQSLERHGTTRRIFSGDCGWVSEGGKNKRIIWDPLREGFDQISDIQIGFKTEVKEASVPRYWAIFWQGSNSAPIGIKIERLSRVGFFAGLRTGWLSPSYRYTVSDAGVIDDYRETGIYEIGSRSRLASFAATGGIILQIARKMYAFGGLGYGKEQLFWEYNEYNVKLDYVGSSWALNESVNSEGAFYDLGITMRVSNRFFIELGTGTENFRSYQILGGIGYTFSNDLVKR